VRAEWRRRSRRSLTLSHYQVLGRSNHTVPAGAARNRYIGPDGAAFEIVLT